MVGQAAGEPMEEYLARVESQLRGVAGERSATAAATYGRKLVARGLPPLFDLAHLAYVCDMPWHRVRDILATVETEYTSFRLPKRGGGSRVIHAPSRDLKHIQRWIARYVLAQIPLHQDVHGFRTGRTIVTNAKPHVGQPSILRLDITDFFGSTPAAKAQSVFARLGYTRSLTQAFTRLATLQGALPQGAPTSPALANAVAGPLDRRLAGAATAYDATYTRYADDVTFSGAQTAAPALRRLVHKIMTDEGYTPNPDKVKMIPRSGQQRVTGLVVNGERPSFPRQRRRWLRQEVHYLVRHGEAAHTHTRGYARLNYRDWIYGHVCALMLAHEAEAKSLLSKLDKVVWVS